ncbi:TonB-dependent receptor [candidate division KSB1 bacterium]|nr:TonB-dependent receptor [Candidatus Aminicenantes bacterium]RQW03652.1 MAG: TonB-dependent receptor [candidate division KSB1 bacterium]
MTRYFCIFFMLCYSCHLFCEERKEKPWLEEKIEVIGRVPLTRALQSVTIFGEKELDYLKSAGLKGVLNQTPGILVLSAGHPGQFAYTFARGAAVNQMLFLVDGCRLFDPSSSLGANFSFLSPQVIQKVEIIRGPLSNLYGSSAMGGVVNLITKKSDGIVFSLAGGSHGTYEGDFNWGHKKAPFSFSLNGHFINYSDGQLNDEMQKQGFSLQSAFEKTDLNLRIQLFGNFINSGIPINLGLPTPKRHYWQQNLLLAVPFTYRLAEYLDLETKISFHYNKYEFSDPDDTWNSFFANRSLVGAITAKLNALFWEKLKIMAGLDYSLHSIDNQNNGEVLLEDAGANIFSHFLSVNADLNKFLISASIRLDKYNKLKIVASPQLGLSYSPSANFKIRASYAESFRAPTLPELLNPYWGNSALVPETGKSIECGVDFFMQSLAMGITYFDSQYLNLIGYSPITWKFVNIDEAVASGIEFSIKKDFFKHWQWGLSYTYLRTMDIQYNRDLLRRPRHTFSTELSYQSARFDFFAEMIYVGKRLDYDEILWSVADNPAFNTFNFVLNFPVSGKFSLFVNISNALNRYFEEVLGYPAPLRRFLVGIKYQ